MDAAGLGVGAPLEHRYVSGGSQNEIYEIRRGDLHCALRIPPASAAAERDAGIVREWRIIEALCGTDHVRPLRGGGGAAPRRRRQGDRQGSARHRLSRPDNRSMSDVVTPEDFQAILAQLRDWVRTKVVPREREIADADAIPDDLRKQAADMGLFGYAIPPEWGGLGLDLTQDVELAMELGYTSLAVRSMFGTNNGIAGQVLVNFGTDEQKAAWLGRLSSGEVVASFALTEPGAGSNPAGLQTRAGRLDDGDDWVIDGQKRFITNAPSADLFVVFARTRPADSSGTGIAVFLVPADTAGVEVGAKDRKMGQEGAWTSDVLFSDVRVPASALVGGDVDAGYRAAMTSLARGRVHMAALAVGTAQRALDESVAYAASATQGGTVIGDFQLVQAMIADQQTGVLAGRALVRETAARYVSGEDRRIGPSAAKLFCTEMAGQVADLAVQIHGGSGYMRDMPVERIYRDVRLLRLYEGTSEIQRLIIGGGLIRAQQRRLRAVRERAQLVRLGGGGLVVAGAAGRYGDSRSAIQPVPCGR
jgi:acyl-CoA dehydrogenase